MADERHIRTGIAAGAEIPRERPRRPQQGRVARNSLRIASLDVAGLPAKVLFPVRGGNSEAEFPRPAYWLHRTCAVAAMESRALAARSADRRGRACDVRDPVGPCSRRSS